MIITSHNLSIGYQNIAGKHCPTLGCKLETQIELQNDIEILAETWSKCKNCTNTVEGYDLIEKIDPSKKRNCKKGRDSGGILIFARSHIKPCISVIKKGDNRIWIEIKESLFHDIPNNLKVCAIYAPPEKSHYLSNSFWDDLEGELISITDDRSPTIIIGDLNARTGNLPDFLDIGSDEFQLYNRPKPAPRKNCDSTTNKFGQKTTNLCSSFNLQIANGRFLGDFWGNFTHHNSNQGQSTVDYALVSDNLFEHVDDFKVLPLNTFSDHSKIVLTIKNARAPENIDDGGYAWNEIKPGYKWNLDSTKFCDALGGHRSREIIGRCSQFLDANLVRPAYETLHELFCSAADVALEQKAIPKTPKNGKQKLLKKWYDGECTKLKLMVKELANAKHNNPWDKSIRNRYREIQKQYRKTCVSKRFGFLGDEARKLDNPDIGDFWDIWKTIGEQRPKPQSIPGVTGHQWEEHFKNLFKKQEGVLPNPSPTLEHNAELNLPFTLKELVSIIKRLSNNKAIIRS